MNSRQRTTIVVGMLSMFAMSLVPPWRSGVYGLVFDPPFGSGGLDIVRLLVEYALVFIPTAAVFVLFKTEESGGADELTQSATVAPIPAKNGWYIAAIFGLAFIVIAAFGWHSWEQAKFSERLAKAEAARLAEENAIREKERQAAEQESVRQAARQHEVTGLAKTRNWTQKINGGTVNATFFTYWRNGFLYYRLKLTGAPEAMEVVSAKYHCFRIELNDAEGVPAVATGVSPGQLRLYSDKKGAWTTLETENLSIACPIETYEGVQTWRLVVE